MEKKFYIAGVRNLAGKSKKTGNDYSMFFATVLEPCAIQGSIRDSAGYEAREIEIEEQAFNQLRRESFPLDCVAWLEINRRNEVRISSVKIAQPAKVAPAPMPKAQASAATP